MYYQQQAPMTTPFQGLVEASSTSDSSSAIDGYRNSVLYRPPVERAARVALGPEGSSPVPSKIMPVTTMSQGMGLGSSPGYLNPASSFVASPSFNNGAFNGSFNQSAYVPGGVPSNMSSMPQSSMLMPPTSRYSQSASYTTSPLARSVQAAPSLYQSASMDNKYNMPLPINKSPQKQMSYGGTMGGTMAGTVYRTSTGAVPPPDSYRSDKSGFLTNVIPDEFYAFHLEEGDTKGAEKSNATRARQAEMFVDKATNQKESNKNVDKTINFLANTQANLLAKTQHDPSHYSTSMATGQLTMFDSDKKQKSSTTKKPARRETRTPTQVKKSQAGCCDDFCRSSSAPKSSVTVKKSSKKNH